jgi:hypothetical protein
MERLIAIILFGIFLFVLIALCEKFGTKRLY